VSEREANAALNAMNLEELVEEARRARVQLVATGEG